MLYSLSFSCLVPCAGLLIASLVGGSGEEIMDLKMVVQVREEADGKLIRTVFNPLD